MKIILESALEAYGPGSHWIEKREAVLSRWSIEKDD